MPTPSPYAHPDVAALIALALAEDVGAGDLTCRALVGAGSRLSGTITAKEAGIVCGLELFALVFARVSGRQGGIELTAMAADGACVTPGTVVLR
nr:hypothetical protein [Planctomycetota bacterium]